ncbi:hydrogenosomal membrane protein 31 precursor [Histomonas meleagridis]|uniref:hydrogenosomal membrane protein 31 precursor n=1 Tax=Histomonas meleagridis TaxID=135588 RepID=UPI0035599E8D|nr:hydrogenosomal membrane protein 31 precursor [Histomonas meleagridis]KAH0802593.1 hydrogenosomal membrane protein 31 precursor [Histomonas meleagridis]
MGITIPDTFIQSCNRLEQLRTYFSAKDGITENVSAFAEYNHLLHSLTKEIDMQAAEISFKWEKGTGGIDFEICCMGCNISNRLLSSASQVAISESSTLASFIDKVTTARGIMNKILEIYDPSYAPTLKEDFVHSISSYIDAFYAHATVFAILLKPSVKYSLIAKTAKAASEKYKNCSQIAHSIFFDVLAHICMSENCFENLEYGKGVAYGAKARQLIPSTLSRKDKKSIQKLIDPILNLFKPKFEQYERDNAQIYLDPIPKELEEIPPYSSQCPGKFNWDVSSQVSPIQDSISGSSAEKVNKKLESIRMQANKCICDIDSFLMHSPVTFTSEVAGLTSQIATVRGEVMQIYQFIEGKLRTNAQQIQNNYPDANEHFGTLASLLNQAKNADHSFDQQINVINEATKQFQSAPQQLNSAKNEIQTLVNNAQQIFNNAMMAVHNNASAQAAASVSAKACSDLDGVMSSLDPIFDYVHALSCDMQQVATQHQNMDDVINGLKRGVSQVSMYPLDFIRTRMIISPDKYKGFFQSCALVYKEQGFSGFWTGLKPTIVGAIPYESSNHLIYSWLKQQSFIKTNKVATIPRNLLFGTIAGIVSQALAYPFETVRRRMMVCESDGKPKYNSMKECFQKTYKEEGIKAFYKGIGVNTVKCIPYSALQYALYEEMLKVEDYLIKKF